MWHVVARAVPGRLLVRSWVEGLEVWGMVCRAVPQAEAICVMPDHVHVLAPSDVRERIGRALGGLSRRRNAREGRAGALVARLPMAVEVHGRKKQQRSLRYVHLNPCRAGLVDDPLAWPLSTHRDAVALTWPSVGPRRRSGFHGYVSADSTTNTAGTLLPGGALRVEPRDVLHAVSSVLRVPISQIGRLPLARSLAWEACCERAPVTARRLALELEVSERSVRRRVPVPKEALARVLRVAGDPRFGPLDGLSLLGLKGWSRYARMQRNHVFSRI